VCVVNSSSHSVENVTCVLQCCLWEARSTRNQMTGMCLLKAMAVAAMLALTWKRFVLFSLIDSLKNLSE